MSLISPKSKDDLPPDPGIDNVIPDVAGSIGIDEKCPAGWCQSGGQVRQGDLRRRGDGFVGLEWNYIYYLGIIDKGFQIEKWFEKSMKFTVLCAKIKKVKN